MHQPLHFLPESFQSYKAAKVGDVLHPARIDHELHRLGSFHHLLSVISAPMPIPTPAPVSSFVFASTPTSPPLLLLLLLFFLRSFSSDLSLFSTTGALLGAMLSSMSNMSAATSSLGFSCFESGNARKGNCSLR